jgi:predicted permease
MSDELRDHLDRRAADLVRAGLSPDEARRRAHIEFGGVEAYKEQIRDGRAWAAFRAAPERLWRDMRFAVRRLAAARLFTLFSIGTLAIGIGVTTAMYSVTRTFSKQQVGVRAPEEVVAVQQLGKYRADFSWPEVSSLFAGQTALRETTAVTRFASALSIKGRADLVNGEAVSGTFFQMLGVQPAQGRVLRPDDDRADAPAVAVISDVTWRRRFNRDPHVVGSVVRLAGRPFEVVGVAPPSFRGVTAYGQRQQDLWVPMAVAPGSGRDSRVNLTATGNREFAVFGRLAPGVSSADVALRLTPVVQQLDVIAPVGTDGQPRARQVLVTSAFDPPRRTSDVAIIIFALPALLLLVASTNLANLSISRGASRRHEFAVRRALGATRWQLVREQLVEGAIVATVGGIAGCLVTRQLLLAGMQIARETFSAERMLSVVEPEMSPGVLLAAAGFAVVAFLTASFAPAIQLTRVNERVMLATDAGTGAPPRWRSRANLIALQICVSVCLFLLTAVGVRVIVGESRKAGPAGIDRVAQVDVPFGLQQRDESATRALVDRIVATVQRHPEVEDVALASWGGTIGLTSLERPFVPNAYDGVLAQLTVVSHSAFRLAGVTMRFGRAIDQRDGPGQPVVGVISESVARQIFKVPDATGRDLLVSLPDFSNRKMVTRAVRIIGVTDDPLDWRGHVDGAVFLPFAQTFWPNVSILAKGARIDVDAMATILRTTVHEADPDLAIALAGRANPGRWEPAARLRIMTGSAAALALAALILSMAGLYGVLSHVVARRTRELGLRMALGADRSRIVWLILKDGFRPIVEGLTIGLLAAVVVVMMLQPVFTIPIEAFDPIAFALAAGPLAIAGALACYLPARRAASVDPNVALRTL